jgi:hypothetical protein
LIYKGFFVLARDSLYIRKFKTNNKMENLIEIVKEAANCKMQGFNLSVMDSEYGTNVYITDSLPEVYGAYISLSLNELLSIDTKAREMGFYLLKAAASGLTNETNLILTFIKL